MCFGYGHAGFNFVVFLFQTCSYNKQPMNHRMNFNSAMFMWILYMYYDLSCMLENCAMFNLHKGASLKVSVLIIASRLRKKYPHPIVPSDPSALNCMDIDA